MDYNILKLALDYGALGVAFILILAGGWVHVRHTDTLHKLIQDGTESRINEAIAKQKVADSINEMSEVIWKIHAQNNRNHNIARGESTNEA